MDLRQKCVESFHTLEKLQSLESNEAVIPRNIRSQIASGDLGIHAHNNMNLALPNSIEANKNGIKVRRLW